MFRNWRVCALAHSCVYVCIYTDGGGMNVSFRVCQVLIGTDERARASERERSERRARDVHALIA